MADVKRPILLQVRPLDDAPEKSPTSPQTGTGAGLSLMDSYDEPDFRQQFSAPTLERRPNQFRHYHTLASPPQAPSPRPTSMPSSFCDKSPEGAPIRPTGLRCSMPADFNDKLGGYSRNSGDRSCLSARYGNRSSYHELANSAISSVDSPSSSTSSSSSSTGSPSVSSSASLESPNSSNFSTDDSPSLILPHLYVGDQAQTQLDTISSLNISYILSLQSLPKFLSSSPQSSPPQTPTVGFEKPSNDAKVITQNGYTTTKANFKQDERSSSSSSQKTNDASLSNSTDREIEYATITATSKGSTNETRQIAKQANYDIIGGGDGGLLPSANSSKDYLVKMHRLIKGKCINISDTFEQLLDKFFDETHNFIEEARRNKCNVLVHCKAGISRSPTIAIAYLMKLKRLHLQDAYNFVKRCRPQISPNLNFMGQLVSYERRLLRCRSQLPSPTSSCLANPILIEESNIKKVRNHQHKRARVRHRDHNEENACILGHDK